MIVFPASAPERLGFDVIQGRIDRHLQSDVGRDRFAAQRPVADRGTLTEELGRVWELQQLLRFDDPAPFEPMPDIRAGLRAAAPEEAYLDTATLLDVAAVLSVGRRLHSYLSRRSDSYVRLATIAGRLPRLERLENSVRDAIDSDGRVRDGASPELADIRARIQQREVQLRETLLRELRSAIGSGYATEDQPTIRHGRMVIPVRAEARRKIQGFVHDTSATGHTVFIEPAACLDLNNEIRELGAAERREVERILRVLTAEIRRHLPEIRDGIDALAFLDVLHAKARFSNSIDAVVPQLNDEGVIDLQEARNPVLLLLFSEQRSDGAPRTVVPLDLRLGSEYVTLVITGPNAGGKTVAMKTVGLFALMTAYGLPLPVDERSHFPVFHGLMADIGDDQSMEDDLSTFSSHIAHLKHMVATSDQSTLVLIDEAGTGTDPDEGGALAQAVLEELTARSARTIATTHHGTLKAFARDQAGVENGSMEFDRSTLSPTYRFIAGRPGSSYAFEIAERSGLDEDVLARARELVGEQKSGLEDLIADFEHKTARLTDEVEAARLDREKARKERRTLEDRLRRLTAEREEIREKALDEARRIVAEANAQVERTIREIREAEAEREATQAARQNLERFRERMAVPRKKREEPRPVIAAPGSVSVGDRVVIDEGATTAEVLELHDDEALVAHGAMKLRVKTSRLTRVSGKTAKQVSGRRPSMTDMPFTTARNRIDVRGMRVDEALVEVDRFVDDGIRLGLSRLEILHGKGTGALRNAIQERLATMPDVASFDEAPWDEGGAGVTYVTMQS